MKHKMQFECLDGNCRTVIVGHDYRLDGIRCPRCEGPVTYKPKAHIASDKAYYVREKILERNIKHSFDLTPEQVDAVLSIGDEYKDKALTVEKKQPLLSIELSDIESVPIVIYKGEKIDKKIRVGFDWATNVDATTLTYIKIEHVDPNSAPLNTVTIQHNQLIRENEQTILYADGEAFDTIIR